MELTIGELCVLIEGRLREEKMNALMGSCLRKLTQFERELGNKRRLKVVTPEPPPDAEASELVEPSDDFWAKSEQPSESVADSVGADTDDDEPSAYSFTQTFIEEE